MKAAASHLRARRGASLVEAVISVGVLSVAIPLVFGTFAESGRMSMSTEAETRCGWIVPACMAEIDASRDGKPAYFQATAAGEAFPSAGDVWALGFSAEGETIGKMSKADYEKGVKPSAAKPVRYIASISATAEETSGSAAAPQLMRATIAVEYPAAAPAAKRKSIEFHTRIP